MTEQPGFVIIPSSEQGRYNAFQASLYRLMEQLPRGSGVIWHQGLDIPFQLNHAIKRALADDRGHWVWIIGDDHTFAPDIVTRLLAHREQVVSPLVLKRSHPCTTVAYGPDLKPLSFTEHDRGLVQVHASGNAGMLIRRSTLELVGDPWFTRGTGPMISEDLAFCARLRELHIPIWVDLDTWMGHITPVEIWPHRNAAGRWNVQYRNNLTMEVL